MGPRLVFVINSLGRGGAERVLLALLAHGVRRRPDAEIHLVLLDALPRTREPPAGVIVHELDGRGALGRSAWRLTRLLRRLRPSLVVCFLVRANVAGAIAATFAGAPAILCERMHLSSHLAARRGMAAAVAARVPRLAYRGAARVVGVSTGVTEDLVRRHGVPRERAVTIVNPYDLDAIRAEGREEPAVALPPEFVVAVGRLEPSKAFDTLIDAFLRADAARALVILGDGSERARLERLVADRGAADRIFLPGHLPRPFAVVGRALFFAASSLNEGFPNAMVEAMALGRAVVATNCPSGPAEILAGDAELEVDAPFEATFGVLVPTGSVDALAAGLRLMADPVRRARYADAAARRAEAFAAEPVTDRFWRLFEEVATPARS